MLYPPVTADRSNASGKKEAELEKGDTLVAGIMPGAPGPGELKDAIGAYVKNTLKVSVHLNSFLVAECK